MRTAIILGAIVLLLLLLLLLPVGAEALYGDEGFLLWLRIGAFRKRLLPQSEEQKRKKQEKKAKKKKKTKKEPTEEPEEKEKKGGSLRTFRELLPIGLDALGRLKRALLIRRLELRFVMANDDPAAAALGFGAASAGAGMVVPLLRRNFRIRRLDIQNAVDFTAEEPTLYAHADIRLRPITVIAIGLHVLRAYLKGKKAQARQTPPVQETERKEKHGKASDR